MPTMVLSINSPHTPLRFYSSSLRSSIPLPHFVVLPELPARRRRSSQRKGSLLFIRAISSGSGDGSGAFSWERISGSFTRGTEMFWSNFMATFRKETGFDPDVAGRMMERVIDVVNKGRGSVDWFRLEFVPKFVEWNRWENWKDLNKWEAKRICTFILYSIVISISCQRICVAFTSYAHQQSRRELSEAYMEALIPEPTPTNVRKFKMGIWRKTMPKGLIIRKFTKGPGGTYIQDSSYIGEDAWDGDIQASEERTSVINKNVRLNREQKEELKEDLHVSEHATTWRDRLKMWKEIIRKDKLAEQIDSITSKYVLDFDMEEVEKSLRKDIVEKASNSQGTRALWISKRWWLYRPKLPYSYFLDKLDSSEVAAVVFTEDLKRVYITMKEGFPLEYIVDIPLDPYMFEAISSSGCEVDLLQKWQRDYFLKVVLALAPGLIILLLIRELVMLLHVTSQRYLDKKYSQLCDMAYAENFILPARSPDIKSMHNEVILGGDIWDVLDEIMMYMNNPLQYYKKEVSFVRGLLFFGPPGTGKTLFARTLAKVSGLPFVFASGAEFVDSQRSGAARVNQLFSMAKRNAPSLVFVDEIDAIAGRHARANPARRATFDALITQLDGEKEKTGVDRFSLRQAVIFLCATNRPEDLDPEFVRLGRIDRQVYIGLPDAQQRVRIFGVHSAGKRLAEDVDFGKLVFRTVGFSGADIRNLVNEAAIMSVRKRHSRISQQDIVDVLDKQLLEGMGMLLTEEEQQKCETSVSVDTKRLLAVHEAGHILMAHLFPRFDWHAFSQLLPGGKETAISVFNTREGMVDQGYITFGYLKMQMVVAHGGRCAERVVFGNDITDHGRDDLEKITKIAREMVISPGNSKLGLTSLVRRVGIDERSWSLDGELIKYRWDDPYVVPDNMTAEVSELFNRELTRYIEETEQYAINGLSQNRHILDMLIKELMQNSRITGMEVRQRMMHMSPVMFEDFIEPFQVNAEEEGPLPVNPGLSYEPLDVYPAPLHRC